MTAFQKRLVLLLSIVIGLTRFLAAARSLFDWDEALFSLGVREYDVAEHHPHPPGYPLFIAAAKLVHLLGVPEFRSLQVVVLLSAFFIFPALYFLAREIGFDFTTSVCGAAIFAFLPNVWIYSGTGFSDVPAIALAFAACAFLLQGRRDARAYGIGAILLGAAAATRPLNLLIGAIPALVATWHRLRTRSFGLVAAAILLGGVIAGGSYLGAALASSSIDDFVGAVRAQSRYVRDVDSWHSPMRPSLAEVAKPFFLYPFEHHGQMARMIVLALISLGAAIWKRRGPALALLVIFAPIAVLSWLNLDVSAASRYAISYMAVYALLAADGLGLATSAIASRWTRATQSIQAILTAVVIAIFAIWTWPALRTQRTTDAPPVAALEWVQRNVPVSSTIYVHGAYGPHATFLLPGHKVSFFESTDEISMLSGESWIVDWRVVSDGMNFVRPHNTLWKIIRKRNFETSLRRASNLIRFGEGWYLQEGEGLTAFRWMSNEAHVTLPAFRGDGRLSIKFYAPIDAIEPPTVEIYLNDTLLERLIVEREDTARSWVVPSRADAPNDLRIVTSATIRPSDTGKSSDTRELGLRIDALTWIPLR